MNFERITKFDKMSTFIVSARKYRPTRFADVVGQEHVSQTLKNALQSNHLAHAFLFCGPRGVGKTTCARILAKVLNCLNVTDDFEPCNTCDACLAFQENASFNITELDAASNNSVEHIRALIEQVRFQPQQGKYKVFIIDEVHMLSQQAFNAFLKTLEEPPSYAIFILATTEKHKIIPTILSRCQIYDFRRIQVPRIVSHLEHICRKEKIDADPEALHIIAQKADGALRDALSIFDRITASFAGDKITYEDVITNLNVLDYDYYFQVVDGLLQEDVSGMLLLLNDIFAKGFDGDIFINGLAEHLRNILVCKDPATAPLLNVSENLEKKYLAQAALTSSAFIISALDLANQCDINFKTARNKRLHVEMAMIKMTYLTRALQVQHVGQPAALEKKKLRLTEIPGEEPRAAEKGPIPAQTERKAIEPETIDPEPEEIQPVPAAASKYSVPQLKDLSAMISELETTEENPAEEKVEVNLESLQMAWNRYITQCPRDTFKHIMQQSELRLEGFNICVVVGSALSENAIRQEVPLMEFLRNELATNQITLTIQVDKSKAPPPPKKKELLTPKQIYQKMGMNNPMIHEIRKRFDLRPD